MFKRWIGASLLVLGAVSLMGCGGGTCEQGGVTYQLGQSVPAGDDCNSCTCTDDGVACTTMACEPGE